MVSRSADGIDTVSEVPPVPETEVTVSPECEPKVTVGVAPKPVPVMVRGSAELPLPAATVVGDKVRIVGPPLTVKTLAAEETVPLWTVTLTGPVIFSSELEFVGAGTVAFNTVAL